MKFGVQREIIYRLYVDSKKIIYRLGSTVLTSSEAFFPRDVWTRASFIDSRRWGGDRTWLTEVI